MVKFVLVSVLLATIYISQSGKLSSLNLDLIYFTYLSPCYFKACQEQQQQRPATASVTDLIAAEVVVKETTAKPKHQLTELVAEGQQKQQSLLVQQYEQPSSIEDQPLIMQVLTDPLPISLPEPKPVPVAETPEPQHVSDETTSLSEEVVASSSSTTVEEIVVVVSEKIRTTTEEVTLAKTTTPDSTSSSTEAVETTTVEVTTTTTEQPSTPTTEEPSRTTTTTTTEAPKTTTTEEVI
jgi:hypothetical protein